MRCAKSRSFDEEDVPILKLKLADLESKLQRLQDETETVNARVKVEHTIADKLVRERNLQLEILLAEANQRYEEISLELRTIQEACSAMETARDELRVSQTVSSGTVRVIASGSN